MRKSAKILLAALAALPLMAGAEVYTWKDSSGKVHYSDKPPLEKKVQAREVRSGAPSAPDAPKPAPDKPTNGGENAATGTENGGKSAEQLKKESEARQELCDNARKRLIQLESATGILVTKDAKGNQVPLVGDARKAETEDARKDVANWCK